MVTDPEAFTRSCLSGSSPLPHGVALPMNELMLQEVKHVPGQDLTQVILMPNHGHPTTVSADGLRMTPAFLSWPLLFCHSNGTLQCLNLSLSPTLGADRIHGKRGSP